MASLLNLSLEIQEKILLHVESVEDVISLGSSSLSFARILGQERTWRIVLAKTDMVEDGLAMENRMRTISAFLTSLPDSAPLFSLLHQTICERYPALCPASCTCKEEAITVSFPGESELHEVSGLGMELLALTCPHGHRHRVHKARLGRILTWEKGVLPVLAQQEVIPHLVVANIVCCSEEEGVMVGGLLEKSSNWRVHKLSLWECGRVGKWQCGNVRHTLGLWDEPHHHHHEAAEGGVGGRTWERLGRAAARGRVRQVSTCRRVVRRGRREDLGALWGITRVQWNRRGRRRERPWIVRREGKKNGWRKIKKIIAPLHKCSPVLAEPHH